MAPGPAGERLKEKSIIICNQSLGNRLAAVPHLKAGPCASFVFVGVVDFVVVPLTKWMVLLFLFLFLSVFFLDAVLVLL
jgi:hypothetical protein